jgi:ureidoacrylate peracid hydrolase
MFKVTFPSSRTVVPTLIVVDMQNGFVAKGGSYDRLGMNTPLYREIIPKAKGFNRTLQVYGDSYLLH